MNKPHFKQPISVKAGIKAGKTSLICDISFGFRQLYRLSEAVFNGFSAAFLLFGSKKK